MDFVKVFTFDEGQLLVEPKDEQGGWSPHELVVRLRPIDGHKGLEVTHSYTNPYHRDAHFEEFTEEQAQKVFASMQKSLKDGYFIRSTYSF